MQEIPQKPGEPFKDWLARAKRFRESLVHPRITTYRESPLLKRDEKDGECGKKLAAAEKVKAVEWKWYEYLHQLYIPHSESHSHVTREVLEDLGVPPERIVERNTGELAVTGMDGLLVMREALDRKMPLAAAFFLKQGGYGKATTSAYGLASF